MSEAKTIVLVSCSKKKLDHPAPAKDLYQGTLFKLSRAYAEQHADEWYILSAKHGLVLPGQSLEPYDAQLPRHDPRRAQWALDVEYYLRRRIGEPRARGLSSGNYTIVILAGKKYREYLEGYLRSDWYPIETPLAGLPIGKQLAWLKKHT